jgi:hypothetical protein
MRITGQVLGVAAGGAILASRISDHAHDLAGDVPHQLIQRDALILSIHDALYFAAAACVLGVFASLVRGARKPSEDTTAPEASSDGADLLLTGVVLAYLAYRIENANGDSPRLIQAASGLVEPDGEASERALALRAKEEVLSPLSRTLLLNYLAGHTGKPERREE